MKILLIADIHANFEALQTVFDVPHDRAICLGDIVDYGPDPDKCIEFLQKKGAFQPLEATMTMPLLLRWTASADTSINISRLQRENTHGKSSMNCIWNT